MKQIPLQVNNSTGFARRGCPPSICYACAHSCTLAPCPRHPSLAVALRWPVVPLVVGVGLLSEENLVEAAGTEQAPSGYSCKGVCIPPAPRRDHAGKASNG